MLGKLSQSCARRRKAVDSADGSKVMSKTLALNSVTVTLFISSRCSQSIWPDLCKCLSWRWTTAAAANQTVAARSSSQSVLITKIFNFASALAAESNRRTAESAKHSSCSSIMHALQHTPGLIEIFKFYKIAQLLRFAPFSLSYFPSAQEVNN